MKTKTVLFLILLITLKSFSQVSFEKGYYIDKQNQRIDCYIKNTNWKNNPLEFKYKFSENGEIKVASIGSVSEFGIDNFSKFVAATVNIDRSTENLELLSLEKEPIFKEEILFLKVLVDGNAKLYNYNDGNLKRYFYNIENDSIRQLIYKSYKSYKSNQSKNSSNFVIGENNDYKKQLWENLKCSSLELKDFKNLNYKKADLVNIFIEYNSCINTEYVNYAEMQKSDKFNLSIRPRVTSSSLRVYNNIIESRDVKFDNQIGFGLGIEAEYVLPYNKNKWSVFLEPTYRSFQAEKSTSADNVSGSLLIYNVKYSSVEIPMGLRHYFFLNTNSKIFLNVFYILDFDFNSEITLTRNDGSTLSNPMEIEPSGGFGIGLGYKYKNKYSLEFRLLSEREIINRISSWNSEYNSVSIIFGYTIF